MAPPLHGIARNIRHRSHKADPARHLPTAGEELGDLHTDHALSVHDVWHHPFEALLKT